MYYKRKSGPQFCACAMISVVSRCREVVISEVVYKTKWLSPVGMLSIWQGEKGLVRLGLPNEDERIVQRWAGRYFGKDNRFVDLDACEEVFAEVVRQLEGYFAGTQREFDMPLDLRGTPFQVTVWEA